MTINVPTWLVEAAYILGVVGILGLAILGVLFIVVMARFEPWK
jgi:hypothetical protein